MIHDTAHLRRSAAVFLALGVAACGKETPAMGESETDAASSTHGGETIASAGASTSGDDGSATGSVSSTGDTEDAGGDPTGDEASSSSSSGYSEDPGDEGDGDHVIGPDYAEDPDLTDLGNPPGEQFQFTLSMADSAIFNGDDSTLDPSGPLNTDRQIFVYVPAQYADGDEAPLLVIHDGPGQLERVSRALDNLTISRDPARTLPAFVVVAVQNGGGDGKDSERGLEYDTMSDREARFINDEVLAAVLENTEIRDAYPNLSFTDNPWGRGVLGCSSGGAAALTMGWFRPDLFRRIITYSGTFVDQQDDDAAEEAMFPLGAWEYHSSLELIESTERKPLRIFTHCSEYDLGASDPEETHHNWVMANQRTAAALATQGYHYRFVYSLATDHCDDLVWGETLADTLVWMWRGYHSP